jgi:hypothetical protein
MISYCPLDEETPLRQVVRRPPPPKQQPVENTEDTECNYLVMFFVLGVIVLSITDNIRK